MDDHQKQDAASLIGASAFPDGFDRRTFMKVSIGTGFAAAVMPVAAQTMVVTDTDGLTAGTISVTVNGQQVPVYRAQPAGKTNLPVLSADYRADNPIFGRTNNPWDLKQGSSGSSAGSAAGVSAALYPFADEK